MSSHNTTLGDSARAFIDSSSQSAGHAIRSSQQLAYQAMDRLSSRFANARVQTGLTPNQQAPDAEVTGAVSYNTTG